MALATHYHARYIVLALGVFLGLMGNLLAGDHKPPSPVPPWQEIEVLDPSVHPTGNPTVLTEPGPDGKNFVEIPPVVLVHRFYYTGDRTFQAQLLPGGPSIIVVIHPKSGERLYLPVQLPPGAPKVTYTPCSIIYEYGRQSIHLIFSHCGDPRVVYKQGGGCKEKVCELTADIGNGAKKLVQRTDLPKACDKTKQITRNVVLNVVDKTNDLAKKAVSTVGQVAKMVPGVTALTSAAESQGLKSRDAAVSRVQGLADQASASIPTNR